MHEIEEDERKRNTVRVVAIGLLVLVLLGGSTALVLKYLSRQPMTGEPTIGLIPYRKGDQWGYVDTQGTQYWED